MTNSKSILMVAGEASGDNIGGLLSAELRLLRPDIGLFGLGGDRMDTSGVELLYHVSKLSFLGFWEVLKQLPFIRKVENRLSDEIRLRKPSLAILIDYPGFNLRLAGKLRQMGIPVMYYISPQVWAWGKGRIEKIKRLVNRMIVAFEFEQKLYRRNGVSAEWFGHPLLEIVKPKYGRAEFLEKIGFQPDEKYIGLFPGSRKQEIEKILPVMLETLNALRENKYMLKSIVGCASGVDDSVYQNYAGSQAIFTRSLTYDLMMHSELNLVASGTATLECAILGRPQVVLYKTSPITYLIGRSLVRIPYIGLVNVVAEKKIVPEFIQGNCRPRKIVAEIRRLLSDLSYMNSMLAELAGLRGKLGNPGASEKVARAALEMVESAP